MEATWLVDFKGFQSSQKSPIFCSASIALGSMTDDGSIVWDSTAADGSIVLDSTTDDGCTCGADDASCCVEQQTANTSSAGIKTADQEFLAN